MNIAGKIPSGMVSLHVETALPHPAFADVKDPAFVGYIHGLSVPPLNSDSSFSSNSFNGKPFPTPSLISIFLRVGTLSRKILYR